MNKEILVDIPKTTQELLFASTGREKQPVLSPDYIDRRRKAIFQGNDEYRRIKEKIVGQTIRYEPELKKVFTAMLTSVQTDGALFKTCGEIVDALINYATIDKHHNIRTFQFFLEKSRMIFETIEDRWPEAHKEIILYCYRSCIRYMSGKTMPTWDADMGMQEFNDGSSLSDMMWGFRFVDDLITRNSINAGKVCDVAGRRARQLTEEGKLEGDPYALLFNWNIAEDEDVLIWMKQLNENIRAGRYSPILFPKIINYAASFHEKEVFKEVSEEIIKSMKESIRGMEVTRLKDFQSEQFMMHDKSEELYHNYAKAIQDEINSRLKTEEDNNVILSEDDYVDWGSKLLNGLGNDTYISGHSFVYYNDPEVLVRLIRKSNNYQLEQFRRALMMIYSNRIYYEKIVDDYDHLKRLKELVDQINEYEVGAIKSFVINWLKDNLDKYCNRVQVEVEKKHQVDK